jgi:cytidyltransferase-like protein
MSGSAGGNRITRSVVEDTVQDYIKKVLSKFPGFKAAKITGSYNAGTKQDFGDIDLIVQLEGVDKKVIKQDLAKYFATLPDSIIVPFKSEKYKGKKSLSSGELVTILYPIVGVLNEFVQIDNIISISEEESTFKNTFLDYSAEVQGLLLGLAKVICLEEDPKEIFKRLGITNVPTLEPNQEYEFNLSGAGLTLRIVTLDNFKEVDRTDVWKSSDWNIVKKLFTNYNIDVDFKTLLKELVSKLKNQRSKNRIKGIFKSMVSIKSGEVGTPKGDNKQISLNAVDSMLENTLFKGLVKELLSGFITEEITEKSIALYPGKFKPPHKGHFEVAKKLLEKVDRVEILISNKEVEGITAEKSKSLWELYNELLGGRLDIKIIQGSPIKYVLDTIEANPNNHYIAVYGKGEEDRYRNIGKDPRYMNAEVFDGGTTLTDEGNINATDFRHAILSGKDISRFLPDGVNKQDALAALGIDGIAENIDRAEYKMDFKNALALLTQYMIKQGMDIKPLPKLKIIDNDSKNADNILGKTAHYDPSDCSITLYTLNRHPKDILRSFSHEMIHRIQDNEGRLQNIGTTNTNEDDHLLELEKEAYLNGNITFRNWEDSLKNPKPLNEGRYDAISNKTSSMIFNKWKQDFQAGKKQSILKTFIENNDMDFGLVALIKFKNEGGDLRVDGGLEETENGDVIYIDFEVDKRVLPEMWSEISMNLKDVIRHEIEHITQNDELNYPSKFMKNDSETRVEINKELLPRSEYFKLEKEVDANLQGMYLRAKKEKRPFKDVINDYLDTQSITPKEREEILNIWRSRAAKLSLPKF